MLLGQIWARKDEKLRAQKSAEPRTFTLERCGRLISMVFWHISTSLDTTRRDRQGRSRGMFSSRK